MPFCPCYSRVDLRPGPGLVLLLCWRQNPDSQGHLPRSRLAPVPAGWRFLPQRGALADPSVPIALQATPVTMRSKHDYAQQREMPAQHLKGTQNDAPMFVKVSFGFGFRP